MTVSHHDRPKTHGENMLASTSKRLLASGIGAGLLLGTLATKATAQAGVPDFSSNGAAWIAINRDFVAVPRSPPPVSNDPAHPYVLNGTPGVTPTYRVADLSNPNIKPWAIERMRKANDVVLDGGIGYTARSSCMPAGVPGFMMFVVEPIFFVQSPEKILMIFQGDMQVRHIYLDVPHSEAPKPSWYGESVGHYEGDTLVIDTVGLNDRTTIDNFRTPHTEKLHVVERWRLIEGGRQLEVAIAIDDPDTFYAPWSTIQRYRRIQQSLPEEICAENNTQFEYHTPVSTNSDF
jgi:hypothetical protein